MARSVPWLIAVSSVSIRTSSDASVGMRDLDELDLPRSGERDGAAARSSGQALRRESRSPPCTAPACPITSTRLADLGERQDVCEGRLERCSVRCATSSQASSWIPASSGSSKRSDQVRGTVRSQPQRNVADCPSEMPVNAERCPPRARQSGTASSTSTVPAASIATSTPSPSVSSRTLASQLVGASDVKAGRRRGGAQCSSRRLPPAEDEDLRAPSSFASWTKQPAGPVPMTRTRRSRTRRALRSQLSVSLSPMNAPASSGSNAAAHDLLEPVVRLDSSSRPSSARAATSVARAQLREAAERRGVRRRDARRARRRRAQDHVARARSCRHALADLDHDVRATRGRGWPDSPGGRRCRATMCRSVPHRPTASVRTRAW